MSIANSIVLKSFLSLRLFEMKKSLFYTMLSSDYPFLSNCYRNILELLSNLCRTIIFCWIFLNLLNYWWIILEMLSCCCRIYVESSYFYRIFVKSSKCYRVRVEILSERRLFCRIVVLFSNCGIIMDDYIHSWIDTTIEYELAETW